METQSSRRRPRLDPRAPSDAPRPARRRAVQQLAGGARRRPGAGLERTPCWPPSCSTSTGWPPPSTKARLALRLEPESQLALHVAVRVAIAQRRFDAAQAVLAQLLAQIPATPKPNAGRRGSPGSKAAAPRRAGCSPRRWRLIPKIPTCSDLADHHLQAGRVAEAERWARRGLELEPGHADSLVSMGFVLLRQGQLEAARDHAIWALQQDPADRRALALLVAVKARANFSSACGGAGRPSWAAWATSGRSWCCSAPS